MSHNDERKMLKEIKELCEIGLDVSRGNRIILDDKFKSIGLAGCQNWRIHGSR